MSQSNPTEPPDRSAAQGQHLGDLRIRRTRRTRDGFLHRLAARVRRVLPR